MGVQEGGGSRPEETRKPRIPGAVNPQGVKPCHSPLLLWKWSPWKVDTGCDRPRRQPAPHPSHPGPCLPMPPTLGPHPPRPLTSLTPSPPTDLLQDSGSGADALPGARPSFLSSQSLSSGISVTRPTEKWTKTLMLHRWFAPVAALLFCSPATPQPHPSPTPTPFIQDSATWHRGKRA